jgi:hypothetical protein
MEIVMDNTPEVKRPPQFWELRIGTVFSIPRLKDYVDALIANIMSTSRLNPVISNIESESKIEELHRIFGKALMPPAIPMQYESYIECMARYLKYKKPLYMKICRANGTPNMENMEQGFYNTVNLMTNAVAYCDEKMTVEPFWKSYVTAKK